PWYAILEWEGEAEFPFDLAVAISSEQKKQFWKYREGISESLSRHRIYKNDVSIPGGAMPSYVEKIRNLAESLGLDLAVFGHAGDENLHINLICRSSMSADEFNDRAAQFTVQSYELIRSYKGSISAEHGIGLLKREDFARYGDPARIELLRSIKKLLDPSGIMNPGKVLI
ncbi:MAG TPA: FAD-linked oxidase C-terminal domain-containing protein, partial [Leptospiraceae bacterium]|nr:FAD-linked oxidase C-terminal domain-containing protein [Leptospiraceae bacterium]